MTKERPILFNGEMVRAILDGRKTQTRRVVWSDACPYGQPGDRLWVRETWGYQSGQSKAGDKECVWYRAGGDRYGDFYPGTYVGKWRPSIHMPRWASRITLEVKGVRMERLQDISPADARDEGVGQLGERMYERLVPMFHELWNSINAKPGCGWDANPWVWVVEFEKISP